MPSRKKKPKRMTTGEAVKRLFDPRVIEHVNESIGKQPGRKPKLKK